MKKTHKDKIDLSWLLSLDINEFIIQLYHEALAREPELEDFLIYQKHICMGMPKEAVIFAVCTSLEFSSRFMVNNIEYYGLKYKRFMLKEHIKKIPILGRIISALGFYKQMENMFYELIMMDAVRRSKEKSIKDNFLESNAKIQAELEFILSRVAAIDSRLETLDSRVTLNQSLINDLLIKTEANLKGCSLLSFQLHEMIIIHTGLVPTIGLEALQAKLTMKLLDAKDEFIIYDQLPIEKIACYVQEKAMLVGYYAGILKDYLSNTSIVDIKTTDVYFPAKLPSLAKGMDTLIVLNPSLSVLLLSSPSLLLDTAHSIKKKLVLLVRTSPEVITAIWDGFSDVEESDWGIYRWMEGYTKVATVKLYNTTGSIIETKISWDVISLCGYGRLDVSCGIDNLSTEISDDPIKMVLRSVLLPGENTLRFAYYGEARKPSGDKRILSIAINNLRLEITGGNIVSPANLYYDEIPATWVDDRFVRAVLHQNGFFDVKARLYANHGFFEMERGTTRYNFENNYCYISESNRPDFPLGAVTVYEAYRLEHATEEVLTDER